MFSRSICLLVFCLGTATCQFVAECPETSLQSTPVQIKYTLGSILSAKAVRFSVRFETGMWAGIGFKAIGTATMAGLDIVVFDSVDLAVRDASAAANGAPTFAGSTATTYVGSSAANGFTTVQFDRLLDDGTGGYVLPTASSFATAWATGNGTVASPWEGHGGTAADRGLITTFLTQCTATPQVVISTPLPSTNVPVAPPTIPPPTLVPATFPPQTGTPDTPTPLTAYVFGRVFVITLSSGFDSFSISEFGTKVLGVVDRLRVKSVIVESICPVAACNGKVCPVATSARHDAGCKLGGTVTTGGHSSQVLQDDTYYVSFDVVATDGYSRNDARASTFYSIQNDIATVNSLPYRPTQIDMATPAVDDTSVAASDDDDGVKWWLIALIVCGALLLVCIIIGICILMKKNPNEEREENKNKKKNPSPAKRTSPRDPDAPVAGHLGGHRGQPAYHPAPQQYHPAPAPTPQQYHPTPQPAPVEMSSYHKPPPSPVFSQPEASPMPLRSFSPGMNVSVEYGADWFPAEVVAVQPDGLYTVNWEDGTHSKDIPPESIQMA